MIRLVSRKTLQIVMTSLLFVSVIMSACTSQSATPESTTTTPATAVAPIPSPPVGNLNVMTHDSFAVSDQVLSTFEKANNVTVHFLASGDAGTALNKAILSKDAPLADVFYGVDNTFLSRALNEGIFEAYNSPLLAGIPDQFKLDLQYRALPVDYGDVCLNYDKNYFQSHNLTPPKNLEDLLKPEYKSLLVVENPATSSPGLAFLLATIGHFGEKNYLDYWRGLVQNDVLVVNDWETAYNREFTRRGGARPVVVSYSSSPPFEVLDSGQTNQEPPTAAVTGNESCFRQIEFVGILKGTKNLALAQKWVDFMLSTTFQEDMPLQMYVFPVNPQARLNPTFEKYLSIPDKTAFVSPQDIAANRDRWIQEWTDVVLK